MFHIFLLMNSIDTEQPLPTNLPFGDTVKHWNTQPPIHGNIFWGWGLGILLNTQWNTQPPFGDGDRSLRFTLGSRATTTGSARTGGNCKRRTASPGPRTGRKNPFLGKLPLFGFWEAHRTMGYIPEISGHTHFEIFLVLISVNYPLVI